MKALLLVSIILFTAFALKIESTHSTVPNKNDEITQLDVNNLSDI